MEGSSFTHLQANTHHSTINVTSNKETRKVLFILGWVLGDFGVCFGNQGLEIPSIFAFKRLARTEDLTLDIEGAALLGVVCSKHAVVRAGHVLWGRFVFYSETVPFKT